MARSGFSRSKFESCDPGSLDVRANAELRDLASLARQHPANNNRADSKNLDMMFLSPVLTPHGLLTLRKTEEAPALEPVRGERLARAFGRGAGHGLLCLGADEVGTALPAVLSYWREIGARYVTALCALAGEGLAKPPVPTPSDAEL